jgi:transposase
VKRSRKSLDIGQPVRVGVDETAARRGHNYITVFVDLDAKRVLFACQGRSSDTLKEFKDFLKAKGANPKLVLEFSSDMSPAFMGGIEKYFPHATVTLDKYHLVAMVSKAVDETRKLEMKGSNEYKRTRWFWLKNPSKLTEKEKAKLAEMLELGAFPKTGKAYGIKLAFQELFKVHKSQANLAFYEWITMAFNAKVDPITKVAVTFFNARDKILSWFQSHISNGILEGLHSVLQARKNAARGYRNTDNLITMSYLLHGKINGPTHTK